MPNWTSGEMAPGKGPHKMSIVMIMAMMMIIEVTVFYSLSKPSRPSICLIPRSGKHGSCMKFMGHQWTDYPFLVCTDRTNHKAALQPALRYCFSLTKRGCSSSLAFTHSLVE